MSDSGSTRFHFNSGSWRTCIKPHSKFFINTLFAFSQISLLHSGTGLLAFLLSGMLFIWSSQPFITGFALCLITPITTHNHPHAERCPTSLSQKENTFLLVTTLGLPGSTLPHFYHRELSFLQRAKPNILAPFFWPLQILVSPKHHKCPVMWFTDVIFFVMQRLSIYTELAFLMFSARDSALVWQWILLSGCLLTFSTKPNLFRQ